MTGGTYFCGDTRFFSLNWALQTIARCKLTGSLRSFWDKDPVDMLVRDGQVVLVTTRDPELYCSEAPITLVNVDAEKITEGLVSVASKIAPRALSQSSRKSQ